MSTSRDNADFFAAPSPGTCTPHGCQCACHNPTSGVTVSHLVACCREDEPVDVGFVNPINTAHAVGEGESI